MLTLGEAKQFLRHASGDAMDATVIEDAVSAITLAFGRHFGPVVQTAVTGERHGPGDGPGRTRLRVHRPPVAAYTSVVEHEGAQAVTLTEEAPGSEPVNGFLAERDRYGRYTGWITRRTSGSTSTFARSWVVVTYTSGRFATTADVPDDWKQAAGIALVAWFRYREPGVETTGEYAVPRAGFPTFVVPQAALDMVPDDRIPDLSIGVA
jgi:hypothetical protein